MGHSVVCSVVKTLIVSGVYKGTKQGTRSPFELFWTAKNLFTTQALSNCLTNSCQILGPEQKVWPSVENPFRVQQWWWPGFRGFSGAPEWRAAAPAQWTCQNLQAALCPISVLGSHPLQNLFHEPTSCQGICPANWGIWRGDRRAQPSRVWRWPYPGGKWVLP